MSSVSKINQLPDELLVLILATSLRDLSSDAHQPLLALICSVCRHWRDVAIGASELWTAIHISLERLLPATQTFLERSKGRLIDLDITELDSVILAHKVAEITAPHISRARNLIMTLPYFDIYNVFLNAYRSISATSLSSLSIHVTDALWSSHGHSPLFASTNSLCYLDTEGDFLRDVPSRASLTTLELNKYSPTHADIQNLFDASPCLETLILHRFYRDRSLDHANEDDGAPITITAPTTLKSLAVSLSGYHTDSNSATSCDCVLGSLRTPNLEYLEVVGSSVLYIDIDLKVHFGQLDKLRTLRIQECTVSSADEEFFLSLKELRRLELVDMSPKEMRRIADPSSSSFSFPRLSSVFLSTTGGYMDGPYSLLQLAERCVAAGCPRFTLEVEKGRSGEIFRAIESCIQDGRVCIIESDCSGLIIDEEESDEEWPEGDIEDDDRWGDGEEYPFDEWPDDDDRWDDEEGYSFNEWPSLFEFDEED